MTWETAANWLRERLDKRFGWQVRLQYVELFSPESFAFPDVMEAIQQGRHQLPIVLVDGEIVLSGGKLNEGLITRHVRERLQKTC
jgi:disulfide oxidoreductase YuzD